MKNIKLLHPQYQQSVCGTGHRVSEEAVNSARDSGNTDGDG